MAKKAKVYTGTEWVDLAAATTDLTNYANMTTTPISGFRNAIINGGFSVWQRGNTVANCAEGVYRADRWAPNEFQNNRVSRVVVTAGQGPTSQYAIRSSSRGSASRSVVYQKIESVNSIPFRGKTVVLSFWLRSSSTTWTSSANSYNGFRYYIGYNTTTTDAAIGQAGGGFDSSTTVLINNGSLPTSWTKYTLTSTVPLTANNIAVRFGMDGDGTATTDTNWFEVTDVQLEEGLIATPFERRPIDVETRLCQRYYQVLKSGAFNSPAVHRIRVDQNSYDGVLSYYVEPRTGNPIYTVNSPSNIIHKPGVRWDTISSLTLTRMGTYVNINCYPSVDDGGNQSGMYLYGIDIIHDCEL